MRLDRPETYGALKKRSLQPGWALRRFDLAAPNFLGHLRRLAGQPFSAAHRVAFSQALSALLAPTKATERTADRFAEMLAREFASAMDRISEGDTHENRFGLTWTYGQGQPGLGTARLRFHLLPTLPRRCPTVVLDAYATEPEYRGVFEHPGTFVRARRSSPKSKWLRPCGWIPSTCGTPKMNASWPGC
ncbi:hypothetical protein ACFSC4_28235 [Deinococcus malanensis]|uniref:hypothetical protein n=1 Tax=Deinococcus malanensis TaxID=1706855 RepID=UPI00363B0E7C